MSEWREIRMSEINWPALRSHIGRSTGVLSRLSNGYSYTTEPKPYEEGCWREKTLGEVADLGKRELLRYPGFGETTLAALQYTIDLAAEGKLPIDGAPAPDALRPSGSDTCPPEARLTLDLATPHNAERVE